MLKKDTWKCRLQQNSMCPFGEIYNLLKNFEWLEENQVCCHLKTAP